MAKDQPNVTVTRSKNRSDWSGLRYQATVEHLGYTWYGYGDTAKKALKALVALVAAEVDVFAVKARETVGAGAADDNKS